MKYKEILPGEKLRPYVKNYFVFESDADVEVNDTVFPGGFMEIIFNLGDGIWKTAVDDIFYTTPPVELWGQITKPLAIRSIGKNKMLGIRFFPHSAAYFLNEEVSEFNNQIADLRDLLGSSVRTLHSKLMDNRELKSRIEFIENFLVSRLIARQRKSDKISVIGKIVNEMKNQSFNETIETVASRYNITPRYLQSLFLQYTGVTPKLYTKINRFQHSLCLIGRKNVPLTTIAYECGYFDQSHFIRDFKSFTGITPSSYSPDQYPVSQAFANG